MEPIHAFLLGVVEGLSEFLPISSTGHLILVSEWLGLQGEAVKTFEIVIQAGAVTAVVGLYGRRVIEMGWKILTPLAISFLPAAIVGILLHKWIKQNLFGTWPVVTALFVGGIFMIALDRLILPTKKSEGLSALTYRQAVLIGLAQCLALWPGTSRSMVTLAAGMMTGLSPAAAAEYSFLLAVPTLGAATIFDLVKGLDGLLQDVGAASVLIGFTTSAVVAAIVMKGFVRYLTSRGLAPFGWYRIAIAGAILLAGCVSGCATAAVPGMRGVCFGMSRREVLLRMDKEAGIISQNADMVVTSGISDDGEPCMRILRFQNGRLVKVEDHLN